MSDHTMTGTCISWDKDKGYGLISCGDAYYLCHHSELQQDGYRYLEIGDSVRFRLKFYNNRLVCRDVFNIWIGDYKKENNNG